MKYYIGIDLGGTNIKAGIVSENKEIIGKASLKTNCPRPADEIVDDIAKAALMALADSGLNIDDIESVGIGTPGTANKETGIVEFSNNLGFYNVPLRAMLEERLNKKTFIDNDANAAAYGEFLAGAAKGTQSAVCITLGTGVGSGIIIDGKILTGAGYAGAELGHTVIDYGGKKCTCGRNGCFEVYASATGLISLTREEMLKNKSSRMWDITGKDVNNIDGKTAFDAMRAGDESGRKVVEMYINYLGCGLVNCVNTFQPEVICIGGGVCKEGETLLAPLRRIIEEESFCVNKEKLPRLCIAQLSNDAGIIGAAFLS